MSPPAPLLPALPDPGQVPPPAHVGLIADLIGAVSPRDPLDGRWRRTRAHAALRCDTCLERDLDANPPPPLASVSDPARLEHVASAGKQLPTLLLKRARVVDRGGVYTYVAAQCPDCGTYYWRHASPEEAERP